MGYFSKNILVPQDEVTIAFVGKYLDLKESYKSLIEALIHAGAHLNTKVNIHWCDSERIEDVGFTISLEMLMEF